MIRKTGLSVLLAALMATAACGRREETAKEAAADPYALRAAETLDSLYAHYGCDSTQLLRENYPFVKDYEATYLASQDDARPNPYSYLWPFSGTLSAISALYEATGDSVYLTMWEERAMPGLQEYYDSSRTPAAYSSYISSAPQSDRFYDDNVWIGIDFTDMYMATRNPVWLEKAREVWKFIESGTDSILGGGIYWCEQKKHSKNTCSNAPGSVYALKLFRATADSSYLRQGKALYEWTRATLQDPDDHLYFDNKGLDGKIGEAKFAYNSGQMIQSGALLFKITGDSTYLRQAQETAEAAYRRFFSGKAKDAAGEFDLLEPGNIWFTAVMHRGFAELYDADSNPKYMDAFARNLDYGWTHARDAATGLFNTDWSGDKTDETKWLLTQAAMCEMSARTAIYNKNKKDNNK